MQIFADKKFQDPIEIIKAFDKESFIEAFLKIEKYRSTHYLLGYIRYEAEDIFLNKNIKSKLPLLYFEVFKSYEKYAPQNNTEIDLQKRALIDYKTYKKAIGKIKKEISCGNTYQVNYTYDWEIKSTLAGIKLYESILGNQTTPYNAYIKNEFEEILSFSPELFFELENNIIKTKPMKGTVQRGKTEAEDKKNIEFLKTDIKNRAENVMIVDLLRNDLGKIAKTGSVKVDKLFEIETHKTVHQMTSEVTAELEKNVSLFEIFEAIFPCGSVTGTPKINTMEIIDELETGKRNVYCGAIGLISPKKTVFSVPIRILQRMQGKKSYTCRVGGAIVWDSTPEEEWQETLTKIKFLDNKFKLVETIKVENLKLINKTAHFKRMKKSAKELGFKFNPNILKINLTDKMVKKHFPRPLRERVRVRGNQETFILRILLSKEGVFETQYLPLNPSKTNKITVSKTPVSSKEPMLYHKTTYRPWYEKSMEKIKNDEIFDEVFFNEQGELTEGARSNIILEIDGKLYTPPVECGLLNGVLRQKTINSGFKYPSPQPSPARGEGALPVIGRKLYLEDLKKADKIYCLNSVRGIVEVELV